MLGTEIDIASIKCAMSNVETNFLNDKIEGEFLNLNT